MAFVIAEPCIGVKDGVCAQACPVDCIHGRPGDLQLYINPDICIDCDVCASVCPVNAIFPDRKVPSKWAHFIEINREYFLKRQDEPSAVTE